MNLLSAPISPHHAHSLGCDPSISSGRQWSLISRRSSAVLNEFSHFTPHGCGGCITAKDETEWYRGLEDRKNERERERRIEDLQGEKRLGGLGDKCRGIPRVKQREPSGSARGGRKRNNKSFSGVFTQVWLAAIVITKSRPRRISFPGLFFYLDSIKLHPF